MTFVVCVSTTKSVAPPLLLLPGKRVNRDVLEGYDIEGANITTAPKRFSTLFFLSGLNSLQTLFLIQLRAHLSWFMMDAAAIAIIT